MRVSPRTLRSIFVVAFLIDLILLCGSLQRDPYDETTQPVQLMRYADVSFTVMVISFFGLFVLIGTVAAISRHIYRADPAMIASVSPTAEDQIQEMFCPITGVLP